MSGTTVFSARRIVTLNRSTPTATHMAVRDGRVLGLGGPEMLDRFGPARLDDRFAGRVLTPGFVEGHGHAMSGKMWRNPYVGYFRRTAPDGAVQGGHTSIAEVVAVLKALETKLPEGAPLVTWGFDPIYFEGPRLSLEDLDSVSTTRPVLVAHASGHIYSVNSVVMERAGFSVDSNIEGLLRNASGGLAGEILGPAAMPRAARAVGPGANLGAVDLQAMRDYAALASRAGVTTATDLSNVMDDRALDQIRAATDDDDFPLRLVPALHGRAYPTA